MTEPRYYALVYFTVTGKIIGEIPLQGIPTWTQMVNNDGQWQLPTLIGPNDGSSGMTKTQLRGITDTWRHSVAICWGNGSATDYVCQAGPLTARQLISEGPPVLQLGGTGFWPLLRKIMQVASTWNGASLAQPGGADSSYTNSMAGIAYQLLVNANTRAGLPLDLVANTDTGTITESYFGYDLISAGQRLQELTQMSSGPDILLKPYLTGTGFVRHTALIGQPTLVTAGRPLVFDYPGNVTSILPTDDGTSQATTTYVKGNGVEYATLWASATSGLTNAGWPLLEVADTSHSDITAQTTLQSWANANEAFATYPADTWAVTVRQDDVDYPFGSYDPGVPATYNVLDHCWLFDGAYNRRILGFQNGNTVGEVVHLLQSFAGVY